MVLAAAGKVDEDALLKLAEALFVDLSPGSRAVAEQARYGGGRLADDRKFEQAHLTMAFEGVGYTAADQYALALYASAVGGGMSSRLFQELREERGLAYSVYAFHSPYRSEEHTSELQSLMRISYAVFCLKKKNVIP